jgi:hypothetical protein
LILELNRLLVGDEVWPYKILVENTHSGALASRCAEQAECELIFCSKFIKGACLAVRQACVFLTHFIHLENQMNKRCKKINHLFRKA